MATAWCHSHQHRRHGVRAAVEPRRPHDGRWSGITGNAVRQLDTLDPANVHERGPSLQPPVGRTLSGAATISHDGRLVTAGTTEGGVIIWDFGTAGAPRLVTSPFPAVSGLVGALAFGPDSRWLAVGSTDNPQVALLDLQQPGTPRVLAELDPGNLAQAVAVSANGAVLAVATAATDVVLWDVSAGPGSPRQLARLGGFSATVQAVAFSPDSRTLAAGSADKSVQLWDVADPSVPHEFTRQRAVDLGSRRPLLSGPISRPRRLSGPRQRCRLRPR